MRLDLLKRRKEELDAIVDGPRIERERVQAELSAAEREAAALADRDTKEQQRIDALRTKAQGIAERVKSQTAALAGEIDALRRLEAETRQDFGVPMALDTALRDAQAYWSYVESLAREATPEGRKAARRAELTAMLDCQEALLKSTDWRDGFFSSVDAATGQQLRQRKEQLEEAIAMLKGQLAAL